MNILAAILKFYREWAWFFWIGAWWVAVFVTMYCIGEADGATGSAQRAMTVEQDVAGIILRVGIGGVKDVVRRGHGGGLGLRNIPEVALQIDNQPRTGWRSWAEAGWRVGAYAIDARRDGSVGLAYRVRVRRFDIATSTAVSDGRVEKVVDAWWTEVVPVTKRITREVPCHVTIRIEATERAGKTLLVGAAWGRADTSSFQCVLVRRIAEGQAAETLDRELAAALRTIQRKGTDWYLGSADIGPILDGIGNGMRGIGPRIGRLRR